MGRRHLRGMAHAGQQLARQRRAGRGVRPEPGQRRLPGRRGRRAARRVARACSPTSPQMAARAWRGSAGGDRHHRRRPHHHRVAVACLEAGLHVLCEKPLALTIRGCDLIAEAAAQRAGRIVSVAENYRRDPINRLARALIARWGDRRAAADDRDAYRRPRPHRDHAVAAHEAHRHDRPRRRRPLRRHPALLPGRSRTVFGEARLHEKVRYNTGSAGPGGFYGALVGRLSRHRSSRPARTRCTPSVASRTARSASGSTTTPGTASPRACAQVFGSRGSLECPGRPQRPSEHRCTSTMARPSTTSACWTSRQAIGWIRWPRSCSAASGSGRMTWSSTTPTAACWRWSTTSWATCVATGRQPEVTAGGRPRATWR